MKQVENWMCHSHVIKYVRRPQYSVQNMRPTYKLKMGSDAFVADDVE